MLQSNDVMTTAQRSHALALHHATMATRNTWHASFGFGARQYHPPTGFHFTPPNPNQEGSRDIELCTSIYALSLRGGIRGGQREQSLLKVHPFCLACNRLCVWVQVCLNRVFSFMRFSQMFFKSGKDRHGYVDSEVGLSGKAKRQLQHNCFNSNLTLIKMMTLPLSLSD